MPDPIPITTPIAKFCWSPASGPVAAYQLTLSTPLWKHHWETYEPCTPVSSWTSAGYPFTLQARAREAQEEAGE